MAKSVPFSMNPITIWDIFIWEAKHFFMPDSGITWGEVSCYSHSVPEYTFPFLCDEWMTVTAISLGQHYLCMATTSLNSTEKSHHSNISWPATINTNPMVGRRDHWKFTTLRIGSNCSYCMTAWPGLV